ncbi:MAG TPA: M48 family metalloprotease [Steroidobacteraceae bacterium]|nr:M48 family metalloprotease [Steroidobacteraceae bacterium]
MRPSCAMMILAALVAGGAAAAELTAVVRKAEVQVFAEPKQESAKLAKLKQDDTVGITAQKGLWYELKLPDGKTGYVRVNDVRVNYGKAADGGANWQVLTTGKSGEGRVTETAGVRGIDESELKSASLDQAQLDAMTGNRSDAAAATAYAGEHGWQATKVAWDGEAKPKSGGKGSKSSSGSSALKDLGGVMGSFGQKMSSALGTAEKVAPKSEDEQAAEELALGPQIAGRVLGARPLWNDAAAQKRVNVIGRWVASQTSRPDLPWSFGVIDTSEINAFAAPGGYVLVTRGLYELLSSDSEVAAVLGHEISHCVERDHYEVIRKQELTAMGKDAAIAQAEVGTGVAETYAKQYVEKHGATILLTSLDRQAEFRADKASEIYLSRSGMNPMALYAVLQKMTALGADSAGLAALYKTHPPLDARMDKIDERGYGALKAYTSRE